MKPNGNGDSCSLALDVFNSPANFDSSDCSSALDSTSGLTPSLTSGVASESDLKPIITPDGAMFYTLSDSLYPNNSISFADAKEFCDTKGMILPVPKDLVYLNDRIVEITFKTI